MELIFGYASDLHFISWVLSHLTCVCTLCKRSTFYITSPKIKDEVVIQLWLSMRPTVQISNWHRINNSRNKHSRFSHYYWLLILRMTHFQMFWLILIWKNMLVKWSRTKRFTEESSKTRVSRNTKIKAVYSAINMAVFQLE